MQHKLILVDTTCFCPSCKAKIDALSATPSVKVKKVRVKLTPEERKQKARDYAREYYRKHKTKIQANEAENRLKRKIKLEKLKLEKMKQWAKTDPMKILRMVKRGKLNYNTNIAIEARKNAGAAGEKLMNPTKSNHPKYAAARAVYKKEYDLKKKVERDMVKQGETKLSIKAPQPRVSKTLILTPEQQIAKLKLEKRSAQQRALRLAKKLEAVTK
jgi:hypothetical protein